MRRKGKGGVNKKRRGTGRLSRLDTWFNVGRVWLLTGAESLSELQIICVGLGPEINRTRLNNAPHTHTHTHLPLELTILLVQSTRSSFRLEPNPALSLQQSLLIK